jgi:hypothetical protein
MDELLPWSPGLGENGFTPNIMRENRITPGYQEGPPTTHSYLQSSKPAVETSSHASFMSPTDMMDSSHTEEISPTTQSLLMMSPPSVIKGDMPPPRSKHLRNDAKKGESATYSDLQKIVSPTASSANERVTGRTLSGDGRGLLSPPLSRGREDDCKERPEMQDSFQPEDDDFPLNEDSIPEVGVEDFDFSGNFSPDGSLQTSPDLKRSRMRGISVESSPNYQQQASEGASMETVSARLSQEAFDQ